MYSISRKIVIYVTISSMDIMHRTYLWILIIAVVLVFLPCLGHLAMYFNHCNMSIYVHMVYG